MKKTLLYFFLTFITVSQAQNLVTQNFDTYASLAVAGWISTNQSTPAGASTWAQGGGTAFTGAYNGAATSFALCNFNSTTGVGTISNWLITPVMSLQNGDVVTFYTKKGGTGTGTIYPDRLELRLSTTGAASVTPSGGAADVGSFATVAVSVNPTLTTTGYPFVWTQYTYTVTGLSGTTDCKFAFRYFVTNGGPDGANSDIVGIDAFSVDRPLSTADFFSKSFSIYPNPVDNVLNLSSKTNTAFNSVQIFDLNGRVVKNTNVNGVIESQINVSDLHAGMYFVEVTSDNGKATSKFIKK